MKEIRATLPLLVVFLLCPTLANAQGRVDVYFGMGAALAALARLDEARSAVAAGLALNPSFSIARARAAWLAASDDPTYQAQSESALSLFRKAGVPEQ